ncbi:MAG TPA: anti-sigma factor [Candidatus Eremiobacteraceae bacterium]|nr:anti-sigma factor [Candidatus Eremiobacteraceae bacterium]
MSDELHVGESAGAYVLGALSGEEAHHVEAHAASCAQCRQEISDLKRVVSVLPLACSSVEPSPDLKARILAAGKGEDQVDAILRRAVISSQQRAPKHDVWHRSLPSWAGVAGWMGLAAACAVAGVFIGIADEHHRMTAIAQPPAPMAQMAARIASAPKSAADDAYVVSTEALDPRVAFIGESKVWDLSVSKTGERIPCKIIQPPNASHAMVVSDMPMTTNGMVYQVWLVRKGKVHKGGIVMPGKMMQTTIPMKVQSGDVIAFTMERPGGSAVPSGPFMMEQTL